MKQDDELAQELTNVLDKAGTYTKNTEILKHVLTGIATSFLGLDKEGKANVLALFIQIYHNNPHIDELYNANQGLLIYSDFQEGFNYFSETLLKVPQSSKACIHLIFSIKEHCEACRLFSIIKAVQGNKSERDEFLRLATEIWEKVDKGEERYMYNLLKTKADILIFNKEYFYAATLCEQVWELLRSNNHTQNVGWIRYQFAVTIVALSKQVKMNLNIQEIDESLVDLEYSASSEINW